MTTLTPQGFRVLYDSLGISMIPLRPGSKVPMVPWDEYQKQRASWEVVEGWFRDGTANLGLICGEVSSGLTIIDFEDEAGYRHFFGENRAEDRTLVVRTPHLGLHAYFFELGDVPRRSIRISEEPPIDLLGSGGFAAGPPSVIDHANCKDCGMEGRTAYTVISPNMEIAHLQGIYQSVVNRCRELGWATKHPDHDADMREVAKGVQQGSRNESAFKYSRHLMYFVGLDSDTAFHELQRWNANNTPPLDDRELKSVFESSKGYPRKERLWECDVCKVRFATKDELKEHHASHFGRNNLEPREARIPWR